MGRPKVSNQENNLRWIIFEARNEEIKEERERKIRASNLIIHGLEEQHQKDLTQAKVADMTFATGLIEAVSAAATIRVAVILGKQEEGKVRPIKVFVNSEKARNAILFIYLFIYL